jgi:uncharacterized membrane protein (DUF2068 family)
MGKTAVARAGKGGTKQGGGRWILPIALFKLVKALLLILVGVGVLSLVHKDATATIARWIAAVRVDPDNRFIHSLLVKSSLWDDKMLEEAGAGTFIYAALFLVEGIGLLLRKRWAEYFTVVITGSFIPLEVYELVDRFTIVKMVAIVVNIAMVWYLIVQLRSGKRGSEHRA